MEALESNYTWNESLKILLYLILDTLEYLFMKIRISSRMNKKWDLLEFYNFYTGND